MAYCKKCGAYIPDGQTKCLACGYDEQAEAAAAAKSQYASQAQYQTSGYQAAAQQREAERAEAEKRRQARQEEARRWAEDFRRQRDEEEQRRRAEQAKSTNTAKRPSAAGEKHTVYAALSYLSALFVLPYFLCPQDSFARFHAKQGLILFAASVIMEIVALLLPIGWIFTLLRLYLIYKGMMNALSGVEEPLPYIGRLF